MDEDADNKADDQEELVAVVDDEEVEDEAAPEGESDKKDDKSKGAKDESSEEEEEGESESEDAEEGKPNGDARVATDEDADNQPKRERKRESAKERRARQKKHVERREKELAYYKNRNEVLERRFSAMDARIARGEKITVGQAITTVEGQIAEAERLEAAAIKSNDGESAVEARNIRQALVNKKERLVAARDRIGKQPQNDREPPPEMRKAMNWIDANKDWYDPKGNDETSAIASAIEDRLAAEGKLDPSTDEFWEELDRRLIKRGIKRAAPKDDDLDEDADDDEIEEQEERRPAKGANGNGKPKAKGGPKVSVGGQKRTLKTNEVYIDPERKKAMQEAGVWDDPKLRQDMLRRYHNFDRDARSSR